jgi:SAM-dependent MidA family methyltransferase
MSSKQPPPRSSTTQRLRQLQQQAAQLPEPDVQAIAHSEQLIELIRNEIDEQGGRISFARYMELALMAPGLGYYSAGSRKFGEQGDFVTAPELSSLFSRCLARQCQQVLSHLQSDAEQVADILEFGAGTGIMAADILSELERLDSLPSRYYILEPSADLQARQRETLQAREPHLLPRVEWLQAMPSHLFNGVILANEVVDAMPVHRLRIQQQQIDECFVEWREHRFQWCYGQPTDTRLQQRAQRLQGQLDLSANDKYVTEINLLLDGWISTLAQQLKKGAIVLIDYGFPQQAYYHVQRNRGTLMCHYRHRSHEDPFVYPGLQDITAHVDFTALAEAAAEAGLDVAGYCTQAHFLLSCGLSEMLLAVGDVDSIDYLKATQQVKTLTSPEQMGELFKVIALSREIDLPLQGFMFKDQRTQL